MPTAVAACSNEGLREVLHVYVWGAKAICKVVNEAWVAGNNPLEEKVKMSCLWQTYSGWQCGMGRDQTETLFFIV